MADIGIRVHIKPMNITTSIMSYCRDLVLLLSKSGVVYKVECGHCNASYVDEAKRRLESRLAEQQRVSQRGKVNVSAVAEHVWNSGHNVNLDSMAVVCVSCQHYSRLPLEVIDIGTQKNSSNHDRGELEIAYDSIIQLCNRLTAKHNGRCELGQQHKLCDLLPFFFMFSLILVWSPPFY